MWSTLFAYALYRDAIQGADCRDRVGKGIRDGFRGAFGETFSPDLPRRNRFSGPADVLGMAVLTIFPLDRSTTLVVNGFRRGILKYFRNFTKFERFGFGARCRTDKWINRL